MKSGNNGKWDLIYLVKNPTRKVFDKKIKYNPSSSVIKENENLVIDNNEDFIVINKNSGISVQDTWKKQVKYLEKEKILKYPEHYYARFNGTNIEEMWVLNADRVLKLLIPKLKRNFNNVKNLKDPRLGASIPKRDIIKYGKKII